MQQQQPQRPVDPHHVPGQHVLVADWHLQEKSAVHFQGLVSERVDGEEAPSGDRGSPYRPSPSWSSDEAARITSNFAGERQNVAGRTVDNEGCSNDSSLYSSVVTLAAPAALVNDDEDRRPRRHKVQDTLEQPHVANAAARERR
eukprot:CAMPEP_0184242940 /NCGR_PEP_ID=MMETSP0976-20121227/29154_1 /TAXON_ID=483370 /ORGANISM="non described non described, Strain CCMP2097" /LENGTH=143 /DNA_ID=CAMNT_0026548191 /DNA_START=177 /DNA_END=606 /DNA_ORIENTATION=-